jgi:hypothetical protein
MSQNISTAENLFDFFHEHVDAAASASGAAMSDDGVYYLSNLLVERGRVDDQPHPETLVELAMKARDEGGFRSVSTWRELGDQALYVSGFFRSSLSRRSVNVDYYLSMGASAYGQLAGLLRVPGTGTGVGLDAVYMELADSFEACAEVLQDVRDAVRAHTHSDIVRLYEEWVTTGNPRAAERLRELGVVPMHAREDTEPGC